MSKVIRYMPDIEGDEQVVVARLMKEMSDEQAEHFARVYRERRKDPTITLVTGLLVLIGFGGIQRFYLDQIGMGVLYLLTFGLCIVGNIIDIVNYQQMTARYNEQRAYEVAGLIEGAFE